MTDADDREDELGSALNAAMAGLEGHIGRDPVRFPRRYLTAGSERDAAIAAVFAAQLAFGRVDLFGAVLERLFAEMDSVGGPAAWCGACARGDGERRGGGRGNNSRDALVYRWFTRRDFVALGTALGRLDAAEGLAAAFTPAASSDVRTQAASALEAGVRRLHGLSTGPDRGAYFDTWFALPSSGSACKRWCMFLRWMVRSEAPDLGLWTHLSPAGLIMPVDTHVLKIARLTNLTARKAPNWTTAIEITSQLRRFCPADPVRYDFAIAHLGISAGCTGAVSDACVGCALKPACTVWVGSPLR
ncbi:MAG: TIGR02757 family protein [Myxococcales bacterium]|nr:TIGR02757 family protein [Myxococcales bacterium]